jgi:phosphopantetheinyl transferase
MNNLLHIEFDHISSYEVSTLLKFSDDWCNSIIDTKRKMESLLARLLLDRICKKIINKNLAQCTFKKNEFGKPFFEDYPDLYISITHSNGYVCTAVSDSAIGIDFEKIDTEFSEDLRIAFDEDDWQKVSKDPFLIYKYFSLKESYSKMMGVGFTQEPSTIKISELKNNIFVRFFLKNKRNIYLFTMIAKNFEPYILPKKMMHFRNITINNNY